MDVKVNAEDISGCAGRPLSTTERALAELWTEVLPGAGVPAAADNFFALGGDSIGMITVLFRIKEEFEVELPSGSMFEAPTLQGLAAVLDHALAQP